MKKQLPILIILFIALSSTIFCQEKFEVEGAIILQDSEDSSPKPGTIRWNGNDFEGWNGVIWASLTGNKKVGTVTDRSGNNYNTIQIGSQEWMTENLRTSKYNDGIDIPYIPQPSIWAVLESGAWSWPSNDPNSAIPYGKHYNGYAVESEKLCPSGWQVPSEEDFNILVDYLGGTNSAGGKLKSTGTISEGTGLWTSPNVGATNETGFAAIPAGSRLSNGTVYNHNMNNFGFYWTRTLEVDIPRRRYFELDHGDSTTYISSTAQTIGLTVRCVKD